MKPSVEVITKILKDFKPIGIFQHPNGITTIQDPKLGMVTLNSTHFDKLMREQLHKKLMKILRKPQRKI